MDNITAPFWETVPLDEMSQEQWESLCDNCGRCCLHKIDDIETGRVYYTNVVCHLYDEKNCRCSDYPNRNKRVPDCVHLTPDGAHAFDWLPGTCAYRLLAHDKPLPAWHPLISGSPDTVQRSGIGIQGECVSENDVDPADWGDYVIAEKRKGEG